MINCSLPELPYCVFSCLWQYDFIIYYSIYSNNTITRDRQITVENDFKPKSNHWVKKVLQITNQIKILRYYFISKSHFYMILNNKIKNHRKSIIESLMCYSHNISIHLLFYCSNYMPIFISLKFRPLHDHYLYY